MPRRRLLVLLMLLTVSPLSAQAPAVTQLAWMAGCWRLESATRVVDEMWMAPAGGVMLGTGRTVVKGRAVEHEFMQIREDAGRIAFVARPSGQAEASFAAITIGEREVIFENPAHDFPQRVIYRRDGTGLTGRIEGTQDGKPRFADVPMRKVTCP
jgi:hypothetical protein